MKNRVKEMFEELSKKVAKEYGNYLYTKWNSALTKDEIKSLKKYKFSSKKINQKARGKEYDYDVVNISNALRKSVIDRDIIVWRESHVKLLEANKENIDTVDVGTRLIEKGFMSTFLYRPKWAFKGKVRLKIKIPKGTTGAYLNKISFFHRWECELLLDKCTVLSVEKKYFENNRMILEVIIQ